MITTVTEKDWEDFWENEDKQEELNNDAYVSQQSREKEG